MHRIVQIVAFVCLMLIGSMGAKAQQSLVVVSNIYPPYVTEDVQNSFLPALFDEIGKEMGVRFEFKILPWLRCEQQVENHDAWGAIPYRKTEDREKTFAFSEPIYLQDSHFFGYDADGHKPRATFDELTDLRGYRIGGINGYYYEPWFEQAGLDVDYANSEEQNFRRLKAGRIDLFSTATTMGWHQIKTLFPPEEVAHFYTLDKPLVEGAGLYLMTAQTFPQNDVLLKRFNVALNTVKTTGTYGELVEKFGLKLRY